MGNEYGPRTIHRHQPFLQKNAFLPILCRLSITDVNINNQCKDRISGDEPTSPKVSCMGQVKRNNRVVGFPTAAATTTSASTSSAVVNSHQKYTKLKRLFSGKTLLPPTTTRMPPSAGAAAAVGGRSHGSRSCRTTREMGVSSSRRIKSKKDCNRNHGDGDRGCVVNIGEMDPPLPVVKRVAPPGVGREEVNIWKRRFNGEGLKMLQIDQSPLRNAAGQQPTTV